MKASLLALVLLATGAPAQLNAPAWTRPITPFPVIGPTDYVGAQGLAAYRIHTRRGAILLDGTLAENVPGIERNIAAQGVALPAIKLLLNSHAHFDHAAGLAQLKRDTGAPLAAGAADRAALESSTGWSATAVIRASSRTSGAASRGWRASTPTWC